MESNGGRLRSSAPVSAANVKTHSCGSAEDEAAFPTQRHVQGSISFLFIRFQNITNRLRKYSVSTRDRSANNTLLYKVQVNAVHLLSLVALFFGSFIGSVQLLLVNIAYP